MKDKDKKESKGYAFLTFTKSNAAQLAIEELHDKEYKVLKFLQKIVLVLSLIVI